MTLNEWLLKWDITLESAINPINGCKYNFVYCTSDEQRKELFNLDDYIVDSVSGPNHYLIQRPLEALGL